MGYNTVSIGNQGFDDIRENKYFYIDRSDKGVVELRRCCYADNPPAPFRKDTQYEHAQLFLFKSVCQPR
jgi:hypothetical protein